MAAGRPRAPGRPPRGRGVRPPGPRGKGVGGLPSLDPDAQCPEVGWGERSRQRLLEGRGPRAPGNPPTPISREAARSRRRPHRAARGEEKHIKKNLKDIVELCAEGPRPVSGSPVILRAWYRLGRPGPRRGPARPQPNSCSSGPWAECARPLLTPDRLLPRASWASPSETPPPSLPKKAIRRLPRAIFSANAEGEPLYNKTSRDRGARNPYRNKCSASLTSGKQKARVGT